jgi:SRSO17 transposase
VEWAGHHTPDGFQRLLNSSVWDADAVRDDVRDYVAERLGPGGVLILDDTGFVKKGTTSAGVGRRYTGTSGKIDNCQIGVFAAYATSLGRALVDRELYLPKAWTSDRDRCRAAKIPDERGFATKGELARDIVRRCMAAGLPATWVTADEAYGQDWHFRRLLEQLDVGYVVAVPKSRQITSLAGIWRIDQLVEEAPLDAWQRLSCGEGAKGPRVYDWAAAKPPTNLIFDPEPPTHRGPGRCSGGVLQHQLPAPRPTPGTGDRHCGPSGTSPGTSSSGPGSGTPSSPPDRTSTGRTRSSTRRGSA